MGGEHLCQGCMMKHVRMCKAHGLLWNGGDGKNDTPGEGKQIEADISD
jgi:hypothetical protein